MDKIYEQRKAAKTAKLEQFQELYDPSLSNEDNIKLMAEHGLELSRRSYFDYKKQVQNETVQNETVQNETVQNETVPNEEVEKQMKDYTVRYLIKTKSMSAEDTLPIWAVYHNITQDLFRKDPDAAMPYYMKAVGQTVNKCRKEKVDYKKVSDIWNPKLIADYYSQIKSIRSRMDSSNTLNALAEEKRAIYGSLFNKLTDMPPVQQILAWEMFVNHLEPNFFNY